MNGTVRQADDELFAIAAADVEKYKNDYKKGVKEIGRCQERIYGGMEMPGKCVRINVGREIPGQNLSAGKMFCVETSCVGLNPRPKSGGEAEGRVINAYNIFSDYKIVYTAQRLDTVSGRKEQKNA